MPLQNLKQSVPLSEAVQEPGFVGSGSGSGLGSGSGSGSGSGTMQLSSPLAQAGAVLSGGHDLPPCFGAVLCCHDRAHDSLQVDHSPVQLTGQPVVLQLRVAILPLETGQVKPPSRASPLIRNDRFCTPLPHDALQGPHVLQVPVQLTGLAFGFGSNNAHDPLSSSKSHDPLSCTETFKAYE